MTYGGFAGVRPVEYHEQSGCPCRAVRKKGCNHGECECNKDAFPRGGILLHVGCEWRPLWDILAEGLYGDRVTQEPTKYYKKRADGMYVVTYDPAEAFAL